MSEPIEVCPVCGDTMDHCSGHGEIGDPVGHAVLNEHDNGIHGWCHLNSDCRWIVMTEREESLWHAGYFIPNFVRETEHGVEYAPSINRAEAAR